MALEVNELVVTNPSASTYMMQANILASVMREHLEELQDSSALKNCVVDFFKDQSKLSASNQVSFDGAGIQLNTSTSATVVNSMDSTTGFSETVGAGWSPDAGAISLDTVTMHEGTGSIKASLSLAGPDKFYAIHYTNASPENWSTSNIFKICAKKSAPALHSVYLMLENSAGATWDSQSFVPTTAFEEFSLDISSCSFLSDIKHWHIVISMMDSTNVDYNFDWARRVATPFYSSGTVESVTRVTTDTDVTHIYFYQFDDYEDVSVSISTQISLDGGTTWHTLVDGEKRAWIDVSTWVELFVNKKNLRFKFTLNTSDTTKTPMLDDYFCQYKVVA